MTDEQVVASQQTCERKHLKGNYKVTSPNGKEHGRFSCMALVAVQHEGWNKTQVAAVPLTPTPAASLPALNWCSTDGTKSLAIAVCRTEQAK
jgi:hypothetical protein